jgi:DNA-binding beta-propeller fold protein YncE
MRGDRLSSESTTIRPVWRYAALGLGATLAAIFGFIALGSGGSSSVIAVGMDPVAIAITSDGRVAYVANASSNSVIPINLATGRTGTAIPVNGNMASPLSGPADIAIAPDDTTAYVTDPTTGFLIPIALRTGTTGQPVRIAGGPGQIAIAPDGATAYVVTGDSTVIPVSLATGTPGKPIPISADAASIAIAPDGATAYVTSYTDTWNDGAWHDRGGKVTPIDLSTGTPGKPILIGGSPDGIAITPDGATAFVTSPDNDTVVPINLATGIPAEPIPDPNGPTGAIAIAPDGATAYVTDGPSNGRNGSVTPINLATGTPGKPIPVGDDPQAIAINPQGTAAYVVNLNGDNVTVLRLKP